MADLIADYLDTLTRELSFDPALARRMREEAEDHLREAISSDPMEATSETERQAIDRFGAARDIAAQCAVPSLVRQTKNAGAAATVIVIGVLIAMRSRIALYGETQRIVGDGPHLDSIRTIILSIDRFSFWCALLIAMCGWAYISVTRTSGVAGAGWHNRLRQSLFLCVTATTAVVITVTADATLAAFRLFPSGWPTSLFLPSLTIGLEMALAVILIIRIRTTMRRLASSVRLFTARNPSASEDP